MLLDAGEENYSNEHTKIKYSLLFEQDSFWNYGKLNGVFQMPFYHAVTKY